MKKGFTLIELLVVVMIVAVLTGIAVPQYRRAVRKAEATEAISMLRTIYDSSERLAAEMGYRDYASLYASGKGKISRMDMFGATNKPAHCTLGDYQINCKKFDYDVYPAGGPRYIMAKLKTTSDAADRVKGVTFVFDRNTQTVYCKNPSDNDSACDIYGFDISGS